MISRKTHRTRNVIRSNQIIMNEIIDCGIIMDHIIWLWWWMILILGWLMLFTCFSSMKTIVQRIFRVLCRLGWRLGGQLNVHRAASGRSCPVSADGGGGGMLDIGGWLLLLLLLNGGNGFVVVAAVIAAAALPFVAPQNIWNQIKW